MMRGEYEIRQPLRHAERTRLSYLAEIFNGAPRHGEARQACRAGRESIAGQ